MSDGADAAGMIRDPTPAEPAEPEPAIAPDIEPAHAVVAAHGDLAAGLVSAVDRITGLGDRLVPLSNSDLGAGQVELALRDALARSRSAVVFTDLPGGSWTFAARRVQRDVPGLVVVTGVNLAMLLDFVFHGALAPDAAAASAVEKGRSAIGCSTATPGAGAPATPAGSVRGH